MTPQGGTRTWLWALAGVAVVLAAGAGAFLAWRLLVTPRNPTVPSAAATPSAKAAASELVLIQKADYAAQYRSLAASDQAKVSQEEWIARARQEASVLGTLTAYKVVSETPLKSPAGAVAVRVRLTYTNLKKPLETELYYLRQGSAMRPAMLWGQRLEY